MGVLIAGELHLYYSGTYTVNSISHWMGLQLSMMRYYLASLMMFKINHGVVNECSAIHHTATSKHFF